MILEQHLCLRLTLGFIRKFQSFVGKHPNFYPKDVCSFPVFFSLNEELRLNKTTESVNSINLRTN